MTQSPLVLYANLMFSIFSIAMALKWQPHTLAQAIEKSATAEYLLKLCGGVEAGLNNLTDTVEAAPPEDRQRLSQGLQLIRERMSQLQNELKLPSKQTCQIRGLLRPFRAQTYRLNQIDQPNRLINWSSRIASSPDQI